MKKISFLIVITVAILSLASWKMYLPVSNGMVITMSMSSSRGMIADMKIYYDQPGTRVEMNASMSSYSFSRTSLIKKAEPGKVYQLDATHKTYSVTDVNNNAEKKDEPATATLLGTDSLNGYSCKHVKVLQGDKKWEMWTTMSITEFPQFSDVMNKQQYIGNDQLHKALAAINAEGFPVKTILTDKEGTTTTTLTGVERKALDASLFTIPSDYKQSSQPAGFPGGYPGRPH
jgi:hypothetical protein